MTDPTAITTVLAEHGVHVPALQVQHAGPDGTIYRFDVDARDAVPTWERLRPLADKTGYYPVVCHDEQGTLAELAEFNEGSATDTLRIADGIVAAEWFEARAADEPELYGEVELGEWEPTEPQTGWSVPFDVLSGKPVDGVWIAFVPTTDPWKVLAYLRYGGWNECPASEEHVAVQRDWHERFGAELVCVSGDVVEMRVARPPTDREAAVALAREQFLYSGGDLVYQGYETLNRLAASLVGAEYWYFWWD